MKLKYKLFSVLCLVVVVVSAQDYFPKNDGVKVKNNNFYAFTNATIHISPSEVISNATLLVKDGKVVSASAQAKIPLNSVTYDLKGKHIYPSFIDPYTSFGVKKPKAAQRSGRSGQYHPSREGYYWNDHIRSEQNATESFSFNEKDADALLKSGFGIVNTHIPDGIARGTGALISLNKTASDGQRILSNKSAQFFSLSRSVTSLQSYPSSLMGTLALLRQFYSDAEWYAKGNSSSRDRSIEAFSANKNLTQIFDAGEYSNVLRADKLGDSNDVQFAIVTGGDSYQSIEQIKNTHATLIVPVDFPKPFDVSNPYDAEVLTVAQMRAWNQAPTNPMALETNQIEFAFTANDLKNKSDFLKNIRIAIAYGLTKEAALKALTTTPAALLNQSDSLGKLEPGFAANFIISSGDLFDPKTELYENWVQGSKFVIKDMNTIDMRGKYTLVVDDKKFQLSISGTLDKQKSKIELDTLNLKSKLIIDANWIELQFNDQGDSGVYRMTAAVDSQANSFSGDAVLPNGNEVHFKATKSEDSKESSTKQTVMNTHKVMPVTYPNVGFGYKSPPKQETILFKNATIWTSEDVGVLENTDLLIKNGKISKIGQDLSAKGARIIDATGKYLTAGIIDEHSHIALKAVNEGGQNSSAEAKMEDVVDPTHMGIYRVLAGGVTSMQLLHGSANPIGAQSAIVKMKWGGSADDMIYKDSPKFIKFALGENVKQSNWGSYTRFPQTRMGVEQVYMNYFQRAKEYDRAKKKGKDVRWDEDLEVLAEILNGERFISCHSYVQSEINMLMKVAEKFNFRVNTFTHILEGYKVADKMHEHGVGGSTFSDWWAYKFEVNDAIPYNAAIMQREGVTVAINSDDAEMARRLNQEAAKTIKYGGMSELEAWKMVTINPAKLLHLDERVGSIKEGKDGDVVLWNDVPLSVYAKPEYTIIEGAVYFSLEKDKAQREAVKAEKNELIQMMISEKEKGATTQVPIKKVTPNFECDTL
jgi:imidazolonepropionase-like amidohydrolase